MTTTSSLQKARANYDRDLAVAIQLLGDIKDKLVAGPDLSTGPLHWGHATDIADVVVQLRRAANAAGISGHEDI